LTSIRGIFDLLRAGSYGKISDEAQAKIDLADGNTSRLLQMVNKLLDLEKLDAGLVELSRSRFAMHELYESALPMVAALAAAVDVVIVTDESELEAWGDADLFGQVLVNLLGNAVRYSPPGTTVRVSAAQRDGGIVMSVEDEGPGVPPADQTQIFERFKQSNARRDKGKGFGLGLSICKAIVVQHGEQIGVESDGKHGSRFWFSLPKAASGSRLPAPSESRD
ncbi:MAG: sensor histidine kinase, partial [Terriglobales bacterium]